MDEVMQVKQTLLIALDEIQELFMRLANAEAKIFKLEHKGCDE